jgi:hypothetical protein
MAQSIGTATHTYEDGSKYELRVEIERKASMGWPARIGEPYVFDRRRLDIDHCLGIGGARQARVLANWLTLLADRLEARGEM